MKAAAKEKSELPTLLFKRPGDWARWLEKNHGKSAGVWVKMAKKATGIASIDYAQAVEGALCYGWIDGQKKGFDESHWVQKFTPRGAKSIWSKINRAKALALVESGQMKPAGRKAMELAQKDGRWEAAYDSQKSAVVPEDLLAALEAEPKAKAFFETLNSVNRYAILFRVQTAKRSETRARKIEEFVAMLGRGEKIYP